MSRLGIDYYLLATLVCAGLLQIVAAHSRLHGLLLIRNAKAAVALGLVLAGAGLGWFVGIGDAAIPGDRGGIEGSEQFVLFLAGAATAAFTTALLASLTQLRRPGKSPSSPLPSQGRGRGSGSTPSPSQGEGWDGGKSPRGMEALRYSTLLQILRAHLRKRP